MKNRCYYLIHSTASLIIGGLIYLVFRENTYIHSILNINIDVLIEISGFLGNFIKFNLTDFLWAYSLAMALYMILLPQKFKSIYVAVIPVLFGILWEILQAVSIIKGTFDWIDCIMYMSASIISIYIYIKVEVKSDEKNY